MHEGSLAMAELESNGVRIDLDYLKAQIKEVTEKINKIEMKLKSTRIYREWIKLFGDNTNLGSKQQLGKLIFDHMKLPRKEVASKKVRNDDGDSSKRESKYSEEAFSLVELRFVKEYFKCEKLKKLKTTYLEGILKEQCNGRVHPFFNLHKVITFRSSSNMPNFQNVPSRNQTIASIIRRCYIPDPGEYFVEIDYGQLEVRIAATYCNDPALIKYIKDPTTDMHRDMAMKLFFLKKEQVDKKTTRDWTKNRFVFPEFYGSTYFQCTPALWAGINSGAKLPGTEITVLEHLKKHGIKSLGDCSPNADLSPGTFVRHVKSVESFMWDDTFSVYTKWKKDAYDDYLKKGYFDYHTGFRVDGLLKRNDVLNYRIQGAAFHCLLQSIVWILKEIKRLKMKTKLVGQIHDSLQASVPANEIQAFLSLAHDMMVTKLRREWKWINVPLDTESEVSPIGESWAMKKIWTSKDGVWGQAG